MTSYLEGSDQIASQLVKAAGRIEQRLFNRYDTNRILVERIEDDGSGTEPDDLTDVQVRTISRIRPIASGGAIGFPERMEQWYWDGCQEQLLSAVEISYDERNLPIEVRHYDQEGRYRYTLYQEYDLAGRLIHQVDAMGYDHFFEYDHCGNLTAELGPRPGYGSRHFYDSANRRIRTDRFGPGGECHSTHYRYDLNSRCIEEENWLGQTVERSYDSLGRMTMERHGQRTQLYEYDGQGALVREVDPLGFETVRTLNARSQPLEINYPDGGSELFLYDLSGREVLRKGRDGLYQRSHYDAMGRLIRVEVGSCEMERAEIAIPSKLPWRALIPAARKGLKRTFQCNCPKVSTFAYVGDRIVSSCDPTGLVRTYGYDGAGRLISEQWSGCRRELSYDSMGRERERRDWFGLSESDYRSAIQLYDDLDRLIEEIEQESDGTVYWRTTHTYDEVGNEIARATYGEGGAIQRSTTEFDFLNRPVRQVDPLGNVTVTEYLTATHEYGQQVEEVRVTDPLGNVTISRKDALGQTVSIEQLDAMGQRVARVEMSYDLNGRCVEERRSLISSSKDRELVTRQEFDAGGRLIRLIEPDGKQTRFTFNDRGQLIAKSTPDGRVFLFEYDGLGRLICERCGAQFYDYSYDLSDRLTGSSNQEGEWTERVYNERGHLVEERQASGLSIRYLCDLLGRRTKVTLPDGSEIDYTYRGYSLQRVSRASYSHDYLEFDESGHCLKERRSLDGGEIQRRWDGAGRLISINSPTYESTLGYDRAGHLTDLMVWDGEGRISQSYSYDALYQLDGEEGHTYLYDSLNNRVECDGEEYEYDDGNQLVRLGAVDFSYDKRGNLIARSDRSERYRFDHRDRLIEVSRGGELYRYEYDSFDRRIAKSQIREGAEERLFYLYDGMNEIAQLSVDGEVEQLRILGSGIAGDIGAVVALELDGEVSLPVTNHRGDLVEVLNSSGDTFENYRYSAFGEEEVTDSAGRLIEPTNPWRFSSKRVDPETGLIYFGHRYYSPELGRWISRDPEGTKDGPNLYAYVKNRPHELIDPRGTSACQIDASKLKPFTFENPFKYSPMRERQTDIFIGGASLDLVNHVHSYFKNRLCDPCKPATLHPTWEERWGGLTSEIIYPGGQFSLSPDHQYFGVMNGINTSLAELDQMGKRTSALWGNRDITMIYNADHGNYANFREGPRLAMAR